MKTYVIGDIHGAHKALIQVLERSGFDYKKDRLICLGDVADGWTEVPACFDELMDIGNLVYIMGNHDLWLYDWFKFGSTPHIWTSQGGKNTIEAYAERMDNGDTISTVKHEKLLNNCEYYFVDDMNNLYVHGGYNWHIDIKNQSPYDIMWDRHLWVSANMWDRYPEGDRVKDYNMVFIGHTATDGSFKHTLPVKASNVWNLDQGAGWGGKLTIMNVETEEYWQSDAVRELYPDVKGR